MQTTAKSLESLLAELQSLRSQVKELERACLCARACRKVILGSANLQQLDLSKKKRMKSGLTRMRLLE